MVRPPRRAPGPRAGLLLALLVLATEGAAQPLPFHDGFDDGDARGWTMTDDPSPQSGPGRWVVSAGTLVQQSNVWSYAAEELETHYHLGTHATAGDAAWRDYTLNALLRSQDDDGLGLIVRYRDARNYYRVLLLNDPAWAGRDASGQPLRTALQRIEKYVDGEPVVLAENRVARAYPSGRFALTLDVRGDSLVAYLDGRPILRARDAAHTAGRLGLFTYACAGVAFDSVSATAERRVYDAPDRSTAYPVTEDRAPYLQQPTPTSVEVAWRSVAPGVGRVRYGVDKDVLDREVVEPSARQKHHVRLEGLEPGTRYYYEVWTDGHPVQDATRLRTAPAADATAFAFLVLGDSGVDTPVQWALGQAMRRELDARPYDFIVHVGDVHQDRGDRYDGIYFAPYRDLLARLNIFTSVGNHDTYYDDAGVYQDDFYLPRNNPEQTERYYSFRWANAYFICLDTNLGYAPGSPQHAFLLAALRDPERLSAAWTVVYHHHPPFSEYWTGYTGEPGVREHLVPLYEAHGVDLVLNGHTHAYERGARSGVTYVISGGGGGALDGYFMDYPHVAVSAGVHHFTRIDVNGPVLHLTATDDAGRIVDRATVTKPGTVRVEAPDVPEGITLDPAFPDPSGGVATIRYRVDAPGPVRLELFDLLGRRVAVLVDRYEASGTHTAAFDGRSLPPGSYLVRLTAGPARQHRRLTLAR